MYVLKALGNRQRAVLMPEAMPRSFSSTKPIIIDWDNGLAIFIRNALTV